MESQGVELNPIEDGIKGGSDQGAVTDFKGKNNSPIFG